VLPERPLGHDVATALKQVAAMNYLVANGMRNAISAWLGSPGLHEQG
jgi:hypothetical protein